LKQLFEVAIAPVNIALTILFVLVIVYWLVSTIFGAEFDTDMDIDVDIDVDLDVDVDMDFDARTSVDLDPGDISNVEVNKEDVVRNRRKKLKWWQIILVYFNFVELPFMFTFTFWVLFWWVISMVGTYFTGSYNNAFGFVFFFGGMIFSLPITKVVTAPFKVFFKNFNRGGEDSIEMLGREGVLSTQLSGQKMTMLEIVIDSSPMKVHVTSKNGETIERGTRVQITNKVESKQVYIVESLN
jgi:hypothetical protein